MYMFMNIQNDAARIVIKEIFFVKDNDVGTMLIKGGR